MHHCCGAKKALSSSRIAKPTSRFQQLTMANRKPPGGMACRLGARSSRNVICTLETPGGAELFDHPAADGDSAALAGRTAPRCSRRAGGVGEVPGSIPIEPHQRIDPAGAVEVGPLVGEPQVHLDDRPPIDLEVDHAGVAGEMPRDPGAAPCLDLGIVLGVHDPVVEHALRAGLAGRVAPPARRAVHHRDVGADMAAFEQRHPHVAGRVVALVVGGRAHDAAADAHALAGW